MSSDRGELWLSLSRSPNGSLMRCEAECWSLCDNITCCAQDKGWLITRADYTRADYACRLHLVLFRPLPPLPASLPPTCCRHEGHRGARCAHASCE